MQFLRKLKNILQSKKFLFIIILFSLLYCGLYILLFQHSSKYNMNETELKGKVSFYKIDGDKVSIVLDAKEKVQVNYYLKTEDEKNYFKNFLNINDVVLLKGKFKEIQNNSVPNTFNYKKYLYYQKIYMVFEAQNVEIISKGFSIKNYFVKRLNNFERYDYLYAFVLGDKSYLDMTDFQKNGVSHLLAISGMHVSFLISFLENKFKIKSVFLINIILWLYCYLVSFSVGVLRVVIFKTIKSIFNGFRVNHNNLIILLLTLIVMLFINPFYLFNYGFLFSFIITFAIIRFGSREGYFKSLIKISLISFLFSLPLTISLNYEINMMTIFNNLIFVPLITFIIFPLALCAFLIPLIEPLLNFSLLILDYVNKSLPVFNIVFPKVNILVILAYYIFLYLVLLYRKIIFILLLIFNLFIWKYHY